MNGLLWALGSAATLMILGVAAELGARWWLRWRRLYYVWPPGLRIRRHPEPEVFPQLERVVRFEVNSDGERGDEVPRSRGSLYRVLVAGGSQTEGFLLDQPTSWPGMLQRLLGTPQHLQILGASRVHVGNIALSGVGSQALDLIFKRMLPRYTHLDSIIIMVGISDVYQWLEKGAPPSLRPSPVPASEVFSCHPEGPFGWSPQKLGLVELLRRFRRRFLRPLEVHERAGKWIGGARAMRARAKEVRTTVLDPAVMLDHFENHFRKLLDKAKAHADRVLVVRQPRFEKDYTPEELAHLWHGGVGKVWREEVTVFYSVEVASHLMVLIDARALRVADELGVEHLDLMPHIERSLKSYYDHCHFTPAGAAAVAEQVAASILRPPTPVRERSFQPLEHVSPAR